MTTKAEYLVVGSFPYIDDALGAVTQLRERGADYEVYSPIPHHGLEEAVFKYKRRSPVRFFTFIGGLSGCLGAFLMTSWMSLDWPIRTSAKTILSYPAFVVIGFECTILLGGIITLLAMFHFCRIPSPFRTPGYRKTFSEGTFGVVVRVRQDEADAVKSELARCGAKEVEVEYAG